MRISDWSSDVCSSDLAGRTGPAHLIGARHRPGADDADLRLIPFPCAQAIAGSPPLSGKGEVMSKETSFAAARLERDVPAAEGRVDDALIAVSSLMTSVVTARRDTIGVRSEEHTSDLQSLMRISYAVFCLQKKKQTNK